MAGESAFLHVGKGGEGGTLKVGTPAASVPRGGSCARPLSGRLKTSIGHVVRWQMLLLQSTCEARSFATRWAATSSDACLRPAGAVPRSHPSQEPWNPASGFTYCSMQLFKAILQCSTMYCCDWLMPSASGALEPSQQPRTQVAPQPAGRHAAPVGRPHTPGQLGCPQPQPPPPPHYNPGLGAAAAAGALAQRGQGPRSPARAAPRQRRCQERLAAAAGAVAAQPGTKRQRCRLRLQRQAGCVCAAGQSRSSVVPAHCQQRRQQQPWARAGLSHRCRWENAPLLGAVPRRGSSPAAQPPPPAPGPRKPSGRRPRVRPRPRRAKGPSPQQARERDRHRRLLRRPGGWLGGGGGLKKTKRGGRRLPTSHGNQQQWLSLFQVCVLVCGRAAV